MTKCPAGSLTNRSAWPKSAMPDRRLRRRPRPRRKPNAQRRRNARPRTASARGRFLARPQKSPIPQGAAQLYRSRQPRASDQGRLHPGLQRASCGRRDQANHRGAWTDAEHERLSAACSPGRRRPGPTSDLQAQREISADAGYCSEANLFGARDPERSAPMSRPGEPSIRLRPRARSAAR